MSATSPRCVAIYKHPSSAAPADPSTKRRSVTCSGSSSVRRRNSSDPFPGVRRARAWPGLFRKSLGNPDLDTSLVRPWMCPFSAGTILSSQSWLLGVGQEARQKVVFNLPGGGTGGTTSLLSHAERFPFRKSLQVG